MNIILLICLTIIIYFVILLCYNKYDFKGLYILSIVSIFVNNFIYLKQIDLFGIMMNLDVFSLVIILIINNMIIQKKGLNKAKKYLLEMIFIMSVSYLTLIIASYLPTSTLGNENVNYYNMLLTINIKSFLAVNVSSIVGILVCSKIYYYFRKERNIIWLSNFTSVIISQFLAAIIYIVIMYFGTVSTMELISMIVIRLIVIYIISIIFTKLIYNIQEIRRGK